MAKKQTQHSSVADMVRNLSEDQAFADDFDKRLRSRQLIKALMVLRNCAALSQQELAGKLGCTQGKISKLESNADADIRFGDLVNYTDATGHEIRIFFVPKKQTVVDEVTMHAFVIKRLLHRLVELAGDDKEMVKIVQRYLNEAAFNLCRVVEIAASELPSLTEESPHPFQVELPEAEECGSSSPKEQRPAGRASAIDVPGNRRPRTAAATA
jgi:transcriptional regulator with XRE-family HTH domain